MNRRKFLQSIGKGAAVAVVTPLAIAEILKEDNHVFDVEKLKKQLKRVNDFEKMKGHNKWLSVTDKYGRTFWYTEWEMLKRQKFEDEMEMKLITPKARGGLIENKWLSKTYRSI